MTYKKFLFLSILIPLPIIFALGILLYIYDLLQIFHKAWFRESTYHQNKMRQQAIGVIRQHDFNSIVIGTSMLMNISNNMANSKLDGNWMNISMPGSSLDERYVVLKYALEHKKIKNVLYSLDGSFLFSQEELNKSNFDFLYDKTILNDIKAYINFRYISCVLTFSTSNKCVGNRKIEDATPWITLKDGTQKFGGFENWIDKNKNIDMPTIKLIKNYNQNNNFYSKIDQNKTKQIIKKFLLDIVKKYENTNFYIIIPTYSRLDYVLKNNFYLYKKMLTWFVNESKKYPNAKVYGFDDLDYADDIANYSDFIHYNVNMNEMQLDAIKNNTHILTTENINEYFKIMEEKIKAYDIKPLQEQIKKANLL